MEHLDFLEAEGIHTLREAGASFQHPVLLYSGGKDSSVLLHLARKAFAPAKPPFPLLHIDTTWNFGDVIAFRDETARRFDLPLSVHTNEEGLRAGVDPIRSRSALYTAVMKTEALRQVLALRRIDAAISGARRDEERSRAEGRIFSHRTPQHRWDPKRQRPELWRLFNTRLAQGESMRVFPLASWTEMDVWTYVLREKIAVVPLYFAKRRPVVLRHGRWVVVDDNRLALGSDEVPQMLSVRFRTLGCYPLSGAIESNATTVQEVIDEVRTSSASERQCCMIDNDQAFSMERNMQEGYF